MPSINTDPLFLVLCHVMPFHVTRYVAHCFAFLDIMSAASTINSYLGVSSFLSRNSLSRRIS